MPDEQTAESMVTVRYWAAAREAAGVDHETIDRSDLTGAAPELTVGAVIAVALARHPALEPVAAVSSLLLDGRVMTSEDALRPGDVLEVLPPFAGG